MADYIKADDLRRLLLLSPEKEYTADDVFAMIDGVPRADAQEVKRGKWEHREYLPDLPDRIYCTACGVANLSGIKTKYCPNCGSRMDGEEK